MTDTPDCTSFRLVACDRDGAIEPGIPLPPAISGACVATAALYQGIGFQPPWIGYVALLHGEAVGGGAFVGAPANDRVEIAYYTLATRQGEGIATQTARELVGIARGERPGIEIYAKTLPEKNASTRILEGLGFQRIGTDIDHEIGPAWAWLLR